ncbi:hypothetical protein PMIN05_000433 [Paraphaeosphaeria minitans]
MLPTLMERSRSESDSHRWHPQLCLSTMILRETLIVSKLTHVAMMTNIFRERLSSWYFVQYRTTMNHYFDGHSLPLWKRSKMRKVKLSVRYEHWFTVMVCNISTPALQWSD